MSTPPHDQEPTIPEQRIIEKPIKGFRYAIYFLIGVFGLVLLSNIAKCGRDTRSLAKSSQTTAPSVTRPEAISEFQKRQQEDAAKLKRQATAAQDAIAKGKEAYSYLTSRMPCYPEIAGTRGTTPDGTPIVCGPDGVWHPALVAGLNDAPTDVETDVRARQRQAAADRVRQKKEEEERRRVAALQSSTLAIDFSDHHVASGPPTPVVAAPPPVQPTPVDAKTAAQNPSSASARPLPVKYDWAQHTGKKYKIFEGTILETVLTNRITGAGQGPMNVMLTTDVWSHDGQKLVIPQGTRCLGTVSAVNSGNEQRLFVSFHRCIMPDGYPIDLDRFQGLNQIGEVGLRDLVNHHYLQIFGASMAVGAMGGLAQIGNFGGYGYDPSTAIRMGVTQQTSQEAIHIFDRFLNQLPSFTIRERARVKIYLSADLDIPAYDSHVVDPTL